MTRPPRRYLTTPIYYASGEPHIGHAYTTLLADALARYQRQAGFEVRLLTGTDEHGQKIQEEAARRGLDPQQLCDDMAARFHDAWRVLDVNYDRFIRTTEHEHREVVRAFLRRLHQRDLIYEDTYRGWYCIHEERYWTEKDLTSEGGCPDCGRPVQEIEEKNYFFRMSQFQEKLLGHIEAHPDWIVPASRRNEVVGFLQKPLTDLSISRPRARVHWGIPLPWDEDHVTYVWVDALINYVTGAAAIDPDQPEGRQGFDDVSDSWWPADLHIIGKDILTTHAVYWPTLLLGAGLPLPRKILAHGWWTVGTDKMSKSLGNVIDPLRLREEFGTDVLRWYLLREMPTGSDASYTPARFLSRCDELSNVMGNLASRSTSMILKYRQGRVVRADAGELEGTIGETLAAFHSGMGQLKVHEALDAAMDLARAANVFVETSEPWVLAREPERAGELDAVLGSLHRVLVVLAALLYPVMPGKMEELAGTLGLPAVPALEEAVSGPLSNVLVRAAAPLFPRPERSVEEL